VDRFDDFEKSVDEEYIETMYLIKVVDQKWLRSTIFQKFVDEEWIEQRTGLVDSMFAAVVGFTITHVNHEERITPE